MDRPIGSRVSAIASKQSEILTSDQELNQQRLEAEAFLTENPQYISKVWQVYTVDPDSVEFWQGASDRNHKRLRYDANAGPSSWKIIRPWP
jgi:pyridoxamine 5'-phosphate oxidase